ncbi:MAG TPA: tetratricopeptide repeat-containing sensor histidine kinase [Puia sp.]|nr:tetratricopeptide repeat-containing sensor histidine kinase [Puia sp.]
MRVENLLIVTVFSLSVSIVFQASGQPPDLSQFRSKQDTIRNWISYCESFRINSNGARNNYATMEAAALKGVELAGGNDAYNRSRFFFYAGFGAYYQVKFDSAQYYFYQSLYEAQKAKSAELIADACVALIPVDFQLRQQDKVDSCKNILQLIIDTSKNEKILQDGYSAMGSYYQQKSYYSTAQDYLLKSVELRKKKIDTTTDVRLKADYAIQCYLLAKQYQNTDVLEKSLAILKEGRRYANASPLVGIRFLSAFTEVYSLLGNIDSALAYEKKLEAATQNSPIVPSEMVSASMNIAQYYLDKNLPRQALPFINKADSLSAKSKSPILIYQSQMISGRYYEQTGEPVKAISLFTQSLPVARQISREQYADILKYLALAEKKSGNLKEALNVYEQYISFSDSLTKEKISRNFADQETRYQTTQKEQRIASLDKENRLNVLELQNASRTKLLLIIGLSALGTISLLLYFIYRNKEKNNRLLNDRNNRLDALNQELSVANDTKAKLFGIISHDLRSPVSQIVQWLKLQKAKPELINGEAFKKYEEKLKTASENLLEVMEDVLLWSKSQMQYFKPQIVPVNISETMAKEINFMQPRLMEKNILIRNNVNPDFIRNTDENFVTVIFRNLLQNAIKYSDEGSEILISNNNNSLSVVNPADPGTADMLNASLQNKQISSKSSGLGLQIVKDLASPIHVQISFSQQESKLLSATLTWDH